MLATAQSTETNHDLLAQQLQKPRIKMERRDSTTSESSLEHLDLGKTPKKLKAHTATSTPNITTTNGGSNNADTVTANDVKNSDVGRSHDTDETHSDEESTDDKRNNAVIQTTNITTITPRPRHHKRRGNRPEKHTSVQLEYNADNPNSLRKKFRFNRSGSEGANANNANGNTLITSNESGFVDASSQYLNASTTQNSASSASSSPHGVDGGASSSPECGGVGMTEREDMKYVCPICEVVSATPHEFTNHIRCHNYASGDTENFTCRICSKVLSSASSLDRHVLVHTGERPFNCKYCHLTFTTNGNMHRHMRTHKQHQSTHQRRNSNGTKSNNNNNNNNIINHNNNKQNNNHISTNTLNNITTTTTTELLNSNSNNKNNNNNNINNNNYNDETKILKTTKANGYHLNGVGVAGIESCDSDDVEGEHNNNNNNNVNKNKNSHDVVEDADDCSTDSISANSQCSTKLNNNNNNKIINNNNNSHVKNKKRKLSTDNCVEASVDNNAAATTGAGVDANGDNVMALMMKRRTKTTINNNTTVDNGLETESIRAATPISDQPSRQTTIEHLMCPVCEITDFGNLLALSEHMDSEHSEIPAKCRHCEVVFRTHRQLNVHPCSGVPQLSIGDFARDKFPLIFRSQNDEVPSKTAAATAQAEALQLKIRSYFFECTQQRRPSFSESSVGVAESDVESHNVTEKETRNQQEDEDQQRREEFLRQMFLKSKRASTPQSENNDEHDTSGEGTNTAVKFETAEQEVSAQQALSISQQSHDSKDFADIQSILNMTSSSSTSNFLKNFEQNVNTPCSNYSLDKDEEEAQDVFTAEFRKMKLRGEFPCKLCTAVYPNLRALKGHNRVHLSAVGPAGPFRCNMCPYSICDKAALIRHMRTHNGDRPYECAVCNYAFTTKANCERHLRNRHGKTTREDVKRAIIYHPSEDSSCDDPAKKMHMFSSPDFDDDLMDLPYPPAPPKDRSTPVSHLKEMLTAGYSSEGSTSQPIKIQVKSLEKLLDKNSVYADAHDERLNTSHSIIEEPSAAVPIDLSMDVLDLSKKPAPTKKKDMDTIEVPVASISSSMPPANTIATECSQPVPPVAVNDDKMDLFLAQQQLMMNETFPKLVDSAQYLQQFYQHMLFQPLNPFFLQNSLLGGNFTDLQKLAPFMSRMFGAGDPAATLNLHTVPAPTPHEIKKSQSTHSPTNSSQISPLLADKTNNNISNFSIQLPPSKTLAPATAQAASLSQLPRHAIHMPAGQVLPGGPVKMVIKNGVLMPKQKQRRYRTERPFACEHCSARFTLRSNMERHVKQQHPQYYAQRQRSGHHVMRGRGSSSGPMSNINHLQAAFAQQQGTTAGNSTISDQVKYAILAQQLKAARRDSSDLLQQALAHGSESVLAPNQMLFGNNSEMSTLTNGSVFPYNHLNNMALNGLNGIGNAPMEDDEPKLIIDEDDNEDEDDDDDDDDDMEDIDEDNEEEHQGDSDCRPEENKDVENTKDEKSMNEPETTDIKQSIECTNAAAKKVAETILEQAIKVGQGQNSLPVIKTEATVSSICAPPPLSNSLPAPALPMHTAPAPSSMKSMIAHAESVGKFLKEVASSPFKDDSQDLVPVSKLVDNATNNAVSFTNLFRPSDVANHMEQSDEEGLVASGSASESNNSGTEDVVTPAEPKKKSAYSLAPNRVSCPYCQRMFPWSSSLRRHILTHTGQKPFKCSHCPLLFTTKSNCDRHLLRKHGNVESAVSVYVPTEDVTEPIPVPKSVEEIEQQQRQREEEQRRRKIEETAAKEHEQRELERQQQQQMVLQQEQEQQQQQQLLKQLASTVVAANNNIYNSPKADSNVVTPAELPYKCHLCESSFGDRFQCLEHIKNQHVQEFTLLLAKGAVDTEVEAQQNTVDEEERRAVEEGFRNGSTGKYPDYSNRKVICAFCVRRFWSTEDLRRHMRTHSGERPFQCEICLRKFTLKHSMLRHMKKHIGRHYNGNMTNGDLTGAGNSGSDFSDDEQLPPSSANISISSFSSTTAPMPIGNPTSSSISLSRPKIQELLNKANEWRNSRLNTTIEQKENIAGDEHSNSQPNDLIGNLLGISDQGILNKLLSSPDEAAKLLGVEK